MKKKQKKMKKVRNWIAVDAWQRSGGGAHKDKKTYKRKKLTKEDIQDILDEMEEDLEENSEEDLEI